MLRLLEILFLIYAGCALFLVACYYLLRIRKPKDESELAEYTRRTYG